MRRYFLVRLLRQSLFGKAQDLYLDLEIPLEPNSSLLNGDLLGSWYSLLLEPGMRCIKNTLSIVEAKVRKHLWNVLEFPSNGAKGYFLAFVQAQRGT